MNEEKKYNKMVYIILTLIILVVLITYFVTSGNKKTGESTILQEDEAITIGLDKYLEFLWIVDGAFNDARVDSKIKVNDKGFDSIKTSFTCKYDTKKELCKGENFEEAFKSIFASNITYNDVYGDGLAYNWYEKRKDGFYFKNLFSCNIERMSENQTIELIRSEKDKLTFKVHLADNIKKGIDKIEHNVTRDFILIKEDNAWKVSRAYYHDLCFQDYYIPKAYSD